MSSNTYLQYIRSLPQQDIDEVIKKSQEYLNSLGYYGYPNEYPGVNRGKSIFCTCEECAAYMAAYGDRHRNVLKHIFEEKCFKIPYNILEGKFDIYDWACGQGLGTITLLESLIEKGLYQNLHTITLIEPSHSAINFAMYHITRILQNFQNKPLIEIAHLDLSSNRSTYQRDSLSTPTNYHIHILSNIIDVDGIDIGWIASIIKHIRGKHIIITSDPNNYNEYRIEMFLNHLKSGMHTIEYEDGFRDDNFGTFYNGRPYGCNNNIICFNITDEQADTNQLTDICIVPF